MQQPTQTEYNNVYEVRFKNTRKSFFKNVNGLSLVTGDFVAVESDRGFDVGQISLGGILAQLQMRKKKVRGGAEKAKKIFRRATKDDLEKLQLARSREQETLVRSREIVRMLNLDMKMSEVEYQGDNTKAIFYYIADQRVDFRELIKLLATEFKIRVEMKQIGLRFESALVGGIGSCGRELCCSTWLSDFKTVSTAAARYQNLSLNPMKISGQCGRLKCCLNFELEAYMDALRDIPKVDRIETEAGMSFLQKTDIFKRTMWFSYASESTWIPLTVDKVIEMMRMNAKGLRPASLHSFDKEIAEEDRAVDFVDVVGQATLREDPKRKKKKKKKKPGQGGAEGQGQPQARQEGSRDQSMRKDRPQGERREGREGAGRDGRDRRNNRDDRRKPENRGPKPEGQAPSPQNQENPSPKPQNQQPREPRPENAGGGDFKKVAKKPKSDRPNREFNPGDMRPPKPESGGEGGERKPRNNSNKNRNRGGRGGGPKPEGGAPTPPPAE
jgi:cell fate regulator YaaT (PSP1 superfamily)